MKRVLVVLLVFGILALVSCGGGAPAGTTTTVPAVTSSTVGGNATTAAPAASITTAVRVTTTTTANSADADALKSAVRGYSAAFLGGHAKEAWLMRTAAAQSRGSYAEFATAVMGAKQLYGDAKMTSLTVTVNGDKGLATYAYDLSDINQTDQAWVKQDGKWLVDNGAAVSGASTSVSVSTTAAQLDAAGIVAKLKAAGLPIGGVIIYTAATDPNHMLGRPNGYLSKAAFTDSRVDRSQATDSLDGSVEVFGNASDAQAREDYIQSALKANPILGTEYGYVIGSALVRVSGLLTPDQAATYRAALGS